MSNQTPEEKISAIKKTAMVMYPLLGTALGYYKFVEDKSGSEKGAKTIRAFRNGILQWRREFVDVTPSPHLFKLFAHALLHVLLKEQERARYHDPLKFRYVFENTVNRFIEISMPGSPLGPGFFRDPNLDGDTVENNLDLAPEGLTQEEVVEMCPVGLPINFESQSPEGESGGEGEGEGAGQGRGQMDIATAALAGMESMAKDIGIGSDLLRILIGDIYEHRIPWEERLKEFCRETFGQEGRTYRRLSKRSWGMGCMVPGRDRGLTTPAIAIDLSGSIIYDNGLVERFLGEICEILRICKKEARIILHEYDVTDDFKSNDPAEIISRIKGGGGTSFVPLYQLLEKEPPLCLVHCTDLYGQFPDVEPNYPVLFVTGKDHADATVAGFGQILECVD